jgi:hypothetical protein
VLKCGAGLSRALPTSQPRALTIEAFQGLSKEQRCDLAARYMRDLGIDGESIVSAQGMFFF